ncbi:MAG: ABC transporter ATP-binding protein [Acidimicrobiales bacterium]
MAGSGKAHLRAEGEALLRVDNMVVEFPVGKGRVVHAVTDVSFDIIEGETLGLVGESGCGKSTTAKAVIQLPRPTSGSVVFEGKDLTQLKGEELRRMRPEIQMIFQDPISSLNPRRRVFDIVSEGVSVWSGKGDAGFATDRVASIIAEVGLDVETARKKRAHEYSGGQCQRISVARALVLDPKIIVCDEPVSALDVSVQAQVLNLLEDMKDRYGLTLLFISHDLSVVKNVSDRIAVMYLGKLCEVGDSDELFANPAHPYTRLLLSAIPDADNELNIEAETLEGELPSPITPPPGCRFHTRCPKVQDVCRSEEPQMASAGGVDHFVACHFPELVESAVTVS